MIYYLLLLYMIFFTLAHIKFFKFYFISYFLRILFENSCFHGNAAVIS